MKKRLFLFVTVLAMVCPAAVYACTSVIISGKASPDGRPIMWKHRDTGFLDNRLEYVKGEKYNFIGLVNSTESTSVSEVWIGSNEAGFSIMNTASYCLNYDDVPSSQMDREGVVMRRALEICATLADFEHFLDTLSRPMGVESNFGCIDAHGGAAYYETSNHGYVKRDVCEMEEGYSVMTNFSFSGKKEDWKGVERYRTASGIFMRMEKEEGRFRDMGPSVIMDSLSRSYEHQGDSLYIPRYITSSSVVIKGVRPGESPFNTVIWTALGYPATSVMIPVPVCGEDHIPAAMKRSAGNHKSELCEMSLELKKNVFPDGKNKPEDMVRAREYMTVFSKIEKCISNDFNIIHDKYVKRRIKVRKYLNRYDKMMNNYVETIRLESEKLF